MWSVRTTRRPKASHFTWCSLQYWKGLTSAAQEQQDYTRAEAARRAALLFALSLDAFPPLAVLAVEVVLEVAVLVALPAPPAIWIAKTPPKGPAGFALAILTIQTPVCPPAVPVQVVPAGIWMVNGYQCISICWSMAWLKVCDRYQTYIVHVDICSSCRDDTHLNQKASNFVLDSSIWLDVALVTRHLLGYIGFSTLWESTRSCGINHGFVRTSSISGDYMKGTGDGTSIRDLRKCATTSCHSRRHIS